MSRSRQFHYALFFCEAKNSVSSHFILDLEKLTGRSDTPINECKNEILLNINDIYIIIYIYLM